jgi:thioredoxin-dependent peroxiredoxin
MSVILRPRQLLAGLAISVALAGSAHAQAAPAASAPVPLKVGDKAPDFTLVTVTADGRTAKPFRLSEHRGETVVLAFFPRARTAGCTVQMESYRDQYAELFLDGRKVTLIGVSTDTDSTLVSWASDAQFPFLLGSDESREVGKSYGASTGTSGAHRRNLYVIDPTGVISYVAAPFSQMAADAYTELGKAVAAAAAVR